MGYYYTARICLNGHLITDRVERSAKKGTFCPQCGEGSITSCPNCGASIPGDYYCEGVLSTYSEFVHPAYCANCGESFPWTTRALEAATTIIMEDENTDQETKKRLVSSLPDLVAETSSTPIAQMRMRKFFTIASTIVSEALKKVLVSLVADSLKSSIGL